MSWSHKQTPYEVLGVDKHATFTEIKNSHRKLVRKCHPDRVRDESLRSQAQGEFQLVQEAYTLLSDDWTREKYDNKIKLAEIKREMQQRGALWESRRYVDGRATSSNVDLDSNLTSESDCDESGRTYIPVQNRRPRRSSRPSLVRKDDSATTRYPTSTNTHDESPPSGWRPRSASSVGRRQASIPRRRSASSLGSRASAGSRASRSSQVSDGSVDEGKSLFHAIDDLIKGHLDRLISASKSAGRVKGRLFSSSSKATSNSALESYKNAVAEFLFAVHYHYHYLSKSQEAENSGIISGSHEKLVVLYDDLKLAITNIESSATSLNLSKLPDNIYEEHRERQVEFRNRLIDICGIPVSVPRICTATRPDSGSPKNCDLGDHGITGDGPFSSLLTKDKQSKKFSKRRRRWKLWKQGPSSRKVLHFVPKQPLFTEIPFSFPK